MLATRDQENLAYAHQQAAAAKPLNQAPKTPGPNGVRGAINSRVTSKRPFQDDENAPFGAKRGGKTLQVGQEKATALQTPAPAERLPLGAKTTNAKTQPARTPAPAPSARQSLTKQRLKTASARKSKLKVHHQPENDIALEPIAAAAPDSDGDSLPDIEYCPPKVRDIPDYPDPDDPYEIKPDDDFSMFSRENYFRNAWNAFEPLDEHGHTLAQREAKERAVDDHRRLNVLAQAAGSSPKLEIEEALGCRSDTSQRCQLDSRSAALALSGTNAAKPVSRIARQTMSTQAKRTITPTAHHKQRMTPGAAASKTTIGHARGRKVSSALKAEQKQELTSREREQRIIDDLCRGTEQLDLFPHDGLEFDDMDDQWQDFKLDVDAQWT